MWIKTGREEGRTLAAAQGLCGFQVTKEADAATACEEMPEKPPRLLPSELSFYLDDALLRVVWTHVLLFFRL